MISHAKVYQGYDAMFTRSLSSTLALSALLCFGALPVLAQETAAPADGTATAPAADAAAAPEISLGAEVGAEAAKALPTKETAEVNQVYLAATFDLWEQRCVKTADGKDPCELFQLLRDADKNPVSEISIFRLPEGNQAVIGATVVTPLETLLTANLNIAVDGGKSKVYPFTFCTASGCVARIGFTAEEVGQLKAGAKATMTLVPAAAPDAKVNLDISLKGFTAAYDALAAQ
jgi:invasion protein IalB